MRALLFVFVAILLALGAPLVWLGGRLAALGGSPYYALAGFSVIVSAALIACRRWSGVWVYMLFVLTTLIWAVWEAGFYGWALAPRLGLPAALALWMFTPWFRAGMGRARNLPGGNTRYTTRINMRGGDGGFPICPIGTSLILMTGGGQGNI